MKDSKGYFVFCTKNESGKMNFYLRTLQGDIYLFTYQHCSSVIFKDYQNGRHISYLFQKSKSYRQQQLKARIMRTCRYIEQEQEICIFGKRSKKPKFRMEPDFEYEAEIA